MQVSIPALSNNPYSPNKLCRSVDEAKLFASEYVLMQLGVMPETGTINIFLRIITGSISVFVFFFKLLTNNL